MKNFEYAQPRTEAEAVELLSDMRLTNVVLAGGTDLVGLMKRFVVLPDRIVDIGAVQSLRQIHQDATGNVWIGAAVHLDEYLDDPRTDVFRSTKQVIGGISSIQLQCQGTVAGELLRRPRCWYYRDGHGLLAAGGRMVVEGDNRYHAILGNRGPAKFVNASRLAPAMISLGAQLRVVGPNKGDESFMDLASLYRAPVSPDETENVLGAGQLVTHVILPAQQGRINAAYEVRQGEGPDQPITAAAVSLSLETGRVRNASIVLGQVAPTPWIADEAARAFEGQLANEESAAIAGIEAVAGAMPLSQNEYKIKLAQVAVKRAILRALGLETGGLDCPMSSESGWAMREPEIL